MQDKRKIILEQKLRKFTIDNDSYDFLHPLRPDDIIAQDSEESSDES
jgi:hypothetical protein